MPVGLSSPRQVSTDRRLHISPRHSTVTAENLEFTFYTEALQKMDAAAFEAAGYPPWVRNRSVISCLTSKCADSYWIVARFEQICNDEGSHVFFLSTVLGPDAVAPCNYSFPYTDPVSFTGRESSCVFGRTA